MSSQESYTISEHSTITADSNSEGNYNKTINFSLGIGSEFSYVNLGIRVYEGFYTTVSMGKMPIPNNDAWLGFSSAKFYKVGVLWKASSDENTFISSIDIGEARLYVQDSNYFLFIPNLARIGSVLAGYEWRYESGIFLALRGGINYTRIQTKANYLRPGLLFNVGWSF